MKKGGLFPDMGRIDNAKKGGISVNVVEKYENKNALLEGEERQTDKHANPQ